MYRSMCSDALWQWLLLGLAASVVLWAAVVLILIVTGRRSAAVAFAAFIPDCVILFKRLLADPRVPRHRKAVLGLAAAYLATPFDLVPDFIPVAGQLDDAILLAVVLRYVIRSGGPELLTELWPGPAESLAVLLRLAHGSKRVDPAT